MADLQTRIERYEYGVLVSTSFLDKPLPAYNREVLLERAATALAANRAFLDTPNASITQAAALVQIKALTRQIDGVIRLLVLDLLDDISDT